MQQARCSTQRPGLLKKKSTLLRTPRQAATDLSTAKAASEASEDIRQVWLPFHNHARQPGIVRSGYEAMRPGTLFKLCVPLTGPHSGCCED